MTPVEALILSVSGLLGLTLSGVWAVGVARRIFNLGAPSKDWHLALVFYGGLAVIADTVALTVASNL